MADGEAVVGGGEEDVGGGGGLGFAGEDFGIGLVRGSCRRRAGSFARARRCLGALRVGRGGLSTWRTGLLASAQMRRRLPEALSSMVADWGWRVWVKDGSAGAAEGVGGEFEADAGRA